MSIAGIMDVNNTKNKVGYITRGNITFDGAPAGEGSFVKTDFQSPEQKVKDNVTKFWSMTAEVNQSTVDNIR